MSDAICGPSNALQNFQKHTSVDRTLQQDRLSSRQSPAQGFRSQSPRDGILDPEFAAFEANLGGPQLPNLQHPAHFGAPAQLPGTPSNSNWAADFQNLNISGPVAPQMRASPLAQAGWENEFLSRQPQQRAPAHHAQAHPIQNRGYQPAFTPNYQMYNTSMNIPQQSHQDMRTEQQEPSQQFDESAFEAAFAQARADLEEQSTGEIPIVTEQEQTQTPEPSTLETTHEEIRIGSDTIPQAKQSDPQTKTHDADALAQTAGQLLDSVRHDQSSKFQQSNFLALMRRLRDREVQVEGDEFREVSSNP